MSEVALRSRVVLERACQVLKEIETKHGSGADKTVKPRMKEMGEAPPSIKKEEREMAVRKELLHKKYWVEGLSAVQIAEDIGWNKATVLRRMKMVGERTRNPVEARSLWLQRELERARQHIRPDVRELLKKLERDPNVERTKHGRIRLWSQPPEVRRMLREEALRLKEIGRGRWGARVIARALDVNVTTINNRFYSSPREYALQWHHKHRVDLREYQRRRKEAREDLINELVERAKDVGEPPKLPRCTFTNSARREGWTKEDHSWLQNWAESGVANEKRRRGAKCLKRY